MHPNFAQATVPFYTGSDITHSFKCRLKNTTDDVDLVIGSSAFISDSNTPTTNLTGFFVISDSAKAVELQARASIAGSPVSWGQPVGYGDNEVYSQLEIYKVA